MGQLAREDVPCDSDATLNGAVSGMVNYLNPLAMYHGKSGAHYGGAGSWYGWPQGQQFPGEEAAGGWHHPHAFQPPPDWGTPSPEFPGGGGGGGELVAHAPPHALAAPTHHFPKREPSDRDPLMPSPPGTASSELSSPGAGGGNGGSPCHQRPPLPRSPYEWMKKPNYQSQPNPVGTEEALLSKTRTKDKYRVVYSDHQRLELEKEFHYSRYITIRRKAELAANLGLSERQVKIWFQNRRAKERKQVKKREEVVLKDKGEHASLQQIHHATVLHHQQMMNGMMHHHHHHAYHQGVLPPEQLVGGVPPVPLL